MALFSMSGHLTTAAFLRLCVVLQMGRAAISTVWHGCGLKTIQGEDWEYRFGSVFNVFFHSNLKLSGVFKPRSVAEWWDQVKFSIFESPEVLLLVSVLFSTTWARLTSTLRALGIIEGWKPGDEQNTKFPTPQNIATSRNPFTKVSTRAISSSFVCTSAFCGMTFVAKGVLGRHCYSEMDCKRLALRTLNEQCVCSSLLPIRRCLMGIQGTSTRDEWFCEEK